MLKKSSDGEGDTGRAASPGGLGAAARQTGAWRRRRKVLIAGVAILAVAFFGVRYFKNGSQQAGPPPGPRPVSVDVAAAERKPVPLQFDAIGTVTPIATAALKSRLETTVIGVHFEDGARVKENDLLFTLDARQIDAQIAQAEATLARDQAQLEGAERDLKRFSELIAKGATTQVNLDNARTQAQILRAAIKADQAALENLAVQKSYTELRAPISGRMSAANVKVGNLVRPADTGALAVVNQMSPVYVTFSIPQRALPELREAMTADRAQVTVAGVTASGRVAMIDNTVDTTTGMVSVRALMPNADEALWPGTLVNAVLTVREDEAVIVPTVAVQRSQTGDFVFVVKDGAAVVQPVQVSRTYQGQSVIASGLSGGESVVTDGQLLLSSGTKVMPRPRKAGA
ncbi:MAG: efflux RND transporter periplasmic adaptor subunit [Xanthobacteraceae bacterium]|nr:MAG: efflux RND transporter periplasmic adaptor subunit [Xanthobacteraceae bacterium]